VLRPAIRVAGRAPVSSALIPGAGLPTDVKKRRKQMLTLSPADYDAVRLSCLVALSATLLSLPLGFAAAYLLTFAKFRGKLILEVVVNLPLTLPPVVVGYFLLLIIGKRGVLGPLLEKAGIQIIFTTKAAILASAVVGFPLLVRSLRVAMQGIDPQLINASRTLGARWYDTLGTIILPLSAPGLAAGSSLMFARSLGEFGATVIVAGSIPGVTQTIPLAIYDYASSPGGETMALSLCLVSVVISMLALLGHEVMARKTFKGGVAWSWSWRRARGTRVSTSPSISTSGEIVSASSVCREAASQHS